ncbi:hypothetical protein ACJJTC_008382 [Scirpophaga incertulas]
MRSVSEERESDEWNGRLRITSSTKKPYQALEHKANRQVVPVGEKDVQYIKEIGATDLTPGLTTYKKVFKSKNLAFHRPKKNQCSLCATYHNESPDIKLKLRDKYEKHTEQKKTVRQLKQTNKQKACAEKSQLVCAS